ncbi:MAG: hypothetical protein IK141_04110 [Clostridia bacterium]|nr:hypothetical protein [Clostridia bacterium]
MNELSALAGSERYRACADEGLGRFPNKRFRGVKTASVSALAPLADPASSGIARNKQHCFTVCDFQKINLYIFLIYGLKYK